MSRRRAIVERRAATAGVLLTSLAGVVRGRARRRAATLAAAMAVAVAAVATAATATEAVRPAMEWRPISSDRVKATLFQPAAERVGDNDAASDGPTAAAADSEFAGGSGLRWWAGTNASLTLEFRSTSSDGLLLYADDTIAPAANAGHNAGASSGGGHRRRNRRRSALGHRSYAQVAAVAAVDPAAGAGGRSEPRLRRTNDDNHDVDDDDAHNDDDNDDVDVDIDDDDDEADDDDGGENDLSHDVDEKWESRRRQWRPTTGRRPFVEVKLAGGRLSVRYRLPGGPPASSRLAFGRDVSDGWWHRLEMIRSGTESTHWRLDEELRSDVRQRAAAATAPLSTAPTAAGNASGGDSGAAPAWTAATQTEDAATVGEGGSEPEPADDAGLVVYFGRVPQWLDSKAHRLALPTAAFERPFVGHLQNLVLSGPDGPTLRELRDARRLPPSQQRLPFSQQRLPSQSGSAGGDAGRSDACSQDMCHGGRCLDASRGPECDCRELDARGRFCEKGLRPAELSLAGGSHLRLQLAEAIVSGQENVSLYFKTSRTSTGTLVRLSHANGLEWFEVRLAGGQVEVVARWIQPTTSPGASLEQDDRAGARADGGGADDAEEGAATGAGSGGAGFTWLQRVALRAPAEKNRSLSDSRWHHVAASRSAVGEISLSVDAGPVQKARARFFGDAFMTHTVLVGASAGDHLDADLSRPPQNQKSEGAPATSAGVVRSYFDGCLKKVELSASGLYLDVVRTARMDPLLVTPEGKHVAFRCGAASDSTTTAGGRFADFAGAALLPQQQQLGASQSSSHGSGGSSRGSSGGGFTGGRRPHRDPALTFTTPESMLILPGWAPKPGGADEAGRPPSTLSMQFRTNEESGVLVYSSPAVATSAATPPAATAFAHLERAFYFVVELRSGQPQLRIGTLTWRRRVTLAVSAADGQWHRLSLSLEAAGAHAAASASAGGGGGSANVLFAVDGVSHGLRVRDSPPSIYDTGGPLFIGGPSLARNNYPAGVWSEAGLHRGFVGCVRDLWIGGGRVELQARGASGVTSGCVRSAGRCVQSPCFHGGVCGEGWNRPLCDCSRTEFAGPTCQTAATTLRLTGREHVAASLGEHMQSVGEEVVFRFRTGQAAPATSMLFSSQPGGLIRAGLDDGRFRLVYRFGHHNESTQVTTQTGYGLDDGQWHYVRILRTAFNIAVMVDHESTFAETPANAKLKLSSMRFGAPLRLPSSAAASSRLEAAAPFVGELQQLQLNGVPLSEPLAPGEISGFLIESSANHPSADSGLATFSSAQAFVALAASPFRGLTVGLRLRAAVDSGIVLHWAGANGTALTLELDEARARLVVARGERRADVVHDRTPLDDNVVHSVRLMAAGGLLRFRVDDREAGSVEPLDARLLEGLVYVGGARSYAALPRETKSRSGFAGCLGVEDAGGQSVDLVSEPAISSELVLPGCRGGGCSSEPCAHGGVCHGGQGDEADDIIGSALSQPTFTCDCSMTSFRGSTCEQESAAYEFNSNGLLLTTWSVDRPRSGDTLVLGVVAEVDNAVLLRVEFLATSEYMQIEIIDGIVFAVYNVAGEDYALNVPGAYVHDGQYHIVRFEHRLRSSSLQLDQLPPKVRKHKLVGYDDDDEYESRLDERAGAAADVKIQLGGVLSGQPQTPTMVSKGFRGILAGVSLNKVRLLELDADRGDIVAQGDTVKLTTISQSRYSPTQQNLADQPLMMLNVGVPF